MAIIPDCFQNYIGIAGHCDEIKPSTGLYINDLEGITTELAADLVSAEDISGYNLLSKKIAFATALVIDDIDPYISPYFQLNSMLGIAKNGTFGATFLQPMNAFRGVVLEKTTTDMQELYISSINVNVDTDAYAAMKLIDGNIIKDYTIQLNKGMVAHIPLNYSAVSNTVKIIIDNSCVSVNDCNIYSTASGCGCRNNHAATHDSDYKDTIKVYGWNGITTDSRCYGITVDAGVQCNKTRLACIMKEKLKYIILYRAGIEIAKEWIMSARLNQATTMNIDKAIHLQTSWEREYDYKFKQFAKSIREYLKNVNDKCITCKSMQYGYTY